MVIIINNKRKMLENNSANQQKIIRFLHPCYHPKIIEDILKNVQKASTSV